MMPKLEGYEFFDCIGSGSFGRVYRAGNIRTHELCAIKIIPYTKTSSQGLSYIDREISVLKSAYHENIVKLLDVVSTEYGKYLIFEYCNGGNLEFFLKYNNDHLPEPLVRYIVCQLVNAMNVLHDLSLVHRDIKLSNVLLHFPSLESRENNKPIVKLGDFGLSRELNIKNMILVPETSLKMSCVGTPFNMAPEVSNGQVYSFTADIWSLGTVIYELVCGKPCFFGQTNFELKRSIDDGICKIPKKFKLSKICLDFISSCLIQDPERRIKWENVLDHPFICGKTTFNLDTNISEDDDYHLLNTKAEKGYHPQKKYIISLSVIDDGFIKIDKIGKAVGENNFVIV